MHAYSIDTLTCYLSLFCLCAHWVYHNRFSPGTLYLQMISFFGMGIISITDAIAESFYCYYMLNRFGLSEIKSGGMLTVSSIIYTVTTFISGCIGSRQKVTVVSCIFSSPAMSKSALRNYEYFYNSILICVGIICPTLRSLY